MSTVRLGAEIFETALDYYQSCKSPNNPKKEFWELPGGCAVIRDRSTDQQHQLIVPDPSGTADRMVLRWTDYGIGLGEYHVYCLKGDVVWAVSGVNPSIDSFVEGFSGKSDDLLKYLIGLGAQLLVYIRL